MEYSVINKYGKSPFSWIWLLIVWIWVDSIIFVTQIHLLLIHLLTGLFSISRLEVGLWGMRHIEWWHWTHFLFKFVLQLSSFHRQIKIILVHFSLYFPHLNLNLLLTRFKRRTLVLQQLLVLQALANHVVVLRL
jgi:hypothetical protein